MRIRAIFIVFTLGLASAGCSNQYSERKDTVTFAAGDAVATNLAVQTPDPWPRALSSWTVTIRRRGWQSVRCGG